MKSRYACLVIAMFPLLSADAVDEPTKEEGFESIFDGTLKGWEGDPEYWKAVDGVLVGEVRADNLLEQNSFIIWRGGELADFELKLEYRVSAEGNSGINYRSSEVTGVKWAMQGYQDDIDGKMHGVARTTKNVAERFSPIAGRASCCCQARNRK